MRRCARVCVWPVRRRKAKASYRTSLSHLGCTVIGNRGGDGGIERKTDSKSSQRRSARKARQQHGDSGPTWRVLGPHWLLSGGPATLA